MRVSYQADACFTLLLKLYNFVVFHVFPHDPKQCHLKPPQQNGGLPSSEPFHKCCHKAGNRQRSSLATEQVSSSQPPSTKFLPPPHHTPDTTLPSPWAPVQGDTYKPMHTQQLPMQLDLSHTPAIAQLSKSSE